MTVSIITPSYNQAQFIEETINSVLANQEANVEYIIIDGGSSDDSVSVIKKHEEAIDYWVSEKDHGQSHAINKGLKKATGNIINWLNSDDYYELDALKKVEMLFEIGTTGVGGKSRLFNSRGTIKMSKGTDVYLNNLAKTMGWARIDQPETFFSKVAWDKVGLLNENLHYCMDREWWIRYLYHFGLDGFKKSDCTLVNFRIHDDSKTTTSQPGFFREHHSIFHIIGGIADRLEACKMIANALDIDQGLETEIRSWTNKELAGEVFDYYLLKSADEFYAANQFKTAQLFLDEIELSNLKIEDVALCEKLSFRLKLPKWMVQLFRRK
jgi:glycosyltransferase involved in cell wall biosynthesis